MSTTNPKEIPKSVFNFYLLFDVYEGFVCLYFCAPRACGSHRGQNREMDSMKLDLQLVVYCYLGAGIHTKVLWKDSQCSELLSNVQQLICAHSPSSKLS